MQALITLGRGDMRRSLNILQSVAMSFDQVDEVRVRCDRAAGDGVALMRLAQESVYACTGQPRPAEVQQMVECVGTR